jgi:hypothetical protein
MPLHPGISQPLLAQILEFGKPQPRREEFASSLHDWRSPPRMKRSLLFSAAGAEALTGSGTGAQKITAS